MKTNDFTSTFQKKTWILVAVMVLAGVITFFIVKDGQEKYKSSAQVAIGNPGNSEKQDRVIIDIDLQNHVEAMKTEFIGTLVAYNLLLHDLQETPFRRNSFLLSPTERNKTILTLKEKLRAFEPLSTSDAFENKVQTVITQKGYDPGRWIKDNNLRVKRIANSNIIQVEFLSENPTMSAFVVNTLCSEYTRYTGFWNSGEAGSDSDSLTKLVTEKKKEWEIKANQLAAFRSTPDDDEYDAALANQLMDYESQLESEKRKSNELAVSLRTVEAEIAKKSSASQIQVSSNSSSKITQLQSKIEELNATYLKSGSKNQELENVIISLRNQLKQELARLDQESARVKNDNNPQQLVNEKARIETAQRTSDSQIQTIQTKINRLRRNSSNGSHLKTKEALEQSYDKALQEYVSVRDAYNKTIGENNVTGVSPAVKLVVAGQPNAEPESTDSLLIVFGVMLIAVVITGGIILGLTHFRAPNNTVESPMMIMR